MCWLGWTVISLCRLGGVEDWRFWIIWRPMRPWVWLLTFHRWTKGGGMAMPASRTLLWAPLECVLQQILWLFNVDMDRLFLGTGQSMQSIQSSVNFCFFDKLNVAWISGISLQSSVWSRVSHTEIGNDHDSWYFGHVILFWLEFVNLIVYCDFLPSIAGVYLM